ncbi:MAG: NUDIX hydrolase [Ktedonobacteraceae bacterium]|nr:NUDIX hydrolase [Ktedonobacteraceae bacterium]
MLTSHANYPRTLHVWHITHNQPFCAGVILLHNGCLVVTLNSDGLPPARKETWRIGGIGGSQRAGETIWDCARREAREALCTDIILTSSLITYFHDIDTGKTTEVSCMDNIAPFLLERQSNLLPYTPYRPGLPAGPHTYFGLFFAQSEHERTPIQPGAGIAGLLFVPLKRWSLLQQYPTLETMLQQGASIIERSPLPRSHRLWLPPGESICTVASLLAWHPDLVVRQTFY